MNILYKNMLYYDHLFSSVNYNCNYKQMFSAKAFFTMIFN